MSGILIGMKEIISYLEMTIEIGIPLQKGMNFRPNNLDYSVFLMSIRKGSPYQDGFEPDGKMLIYEGHDCNKRDCDSPRTTDQPTHTLSGKLTENGKFCQTIEDFKSNNTAVPETIRVFEKIKPGIWADNGFYSLIDFDYILSPYEKRNVFRFKLEPLDIDSNRTDLSTENIEFSRKIPTEVKRLVWARDNGICQQCGSNENLHFDHILPYSKGGTSTNVQNIQLLCQKHNLNKSAKIQ